jgi:AraC family transcriptional regulator
MQPGVVQQAARSIPAEISRTTGLSPTFLVKTGYDSHLVAAKWRLPRMRFTRDGSAQHVLAFHSRGAATVTRTLRGIRTTSVPPAGSVSLTPADAIVESWIESPVEAVHIYIDKAALPELPGPSHDSAGITKGFVNAKDPWLIGYFQMLVSECESLSHPEPFADSPFLAETERLLMRHLRECHFHAAGDAPNEHAGNHLVHPLRPVLVRRIEEYVETHLESDIPLKPLADIAHMSIDHFVRTFCAATGKTPHQYVLERRLDRAAALLRRDSMPLTEVALASGFRNASHFSVRFNAHFGMPPSHYRRGVQP